MSAAADACDRCLRRTDLIAALAGRIDIEWRGSRGRPQLLALPDDELLAWASVPEPRRRYLDFRPARAREAIAAAGLSAVCRCSQAYPEGLRDLPDPPAVVHVLGRLPAGDGISIVGARRATAYGLEVGRGLGRSLAASGLTVVSGMALGIDSAAHEGALEAAAGVTVAVMASGADRCYPARKAALHRQIAARGAVVSEMPPGFGPRRWGFPARNRLIAALGGATVVVEAAERSGSLITADLASEIGRPVAAVPGPLTSRQSEGTNLLLKSGCELVRSAQDVLDLLFGAGAREAPAAGGAVQELRPELRAVYEAVRGGRGSLAELAGADDAMAIAARLGELELLGLVRRAFGGRYVAAM
jgi:DNA processing protein